MPQQLARRSCQVTTPNEWIWIALHTLFAKYCQSLLIPIHQIDPSMYLEFCPHFHQDRMANSIMKRKRSLVSKLDTRKQLACISSSPVLADSMLSLVLAVLWKQRRAFKRKSFLIRDRDVEKSVLCKKIIHRFQGYSWFFSRISARTWIFQHRYPAIPRRELILLASTGSTK